MLKKTTHWLAAFGLCAMLAQPALSATYSFHQDGFSEGAFVSGTFTGSDINMDGFLSSFDNEVALLTGSFSGNSKVGAFSFDPPTFNMILNLSDGGIFLADPPETTPSEGLSAGNGVLLSGYRAGAALGAVCDGTQPCGLVESFDPFIQDGSTSEIKVSLIPLPASAVLLMGGVGALVAVRRRRRS